MREQWVFLPFGYYGRGRRRRRTVDSRRWWCSVVTPPCTTLRRYRCEGTRRACSSFSSGRPRTPSLVCMVNARGCIIDNRWLSQISFSFKKEKSLDACRVRGWTSDSTPPTPPRRGIDESFVWLLNYIAKISCKSIRKGNVSFFFFEVDEKDDRSVKSSSELLKILR